ncbi:MAG: isoprenylcysteine carboxylmethyltransferase family protein [Pseudorhodoplanes sp.]|jgi:protein-S-isoprenylcysteine O-methyltransferase Ste14|nr:isoprenylcysteine carboxylmethyltransferase family protein [Pseudorhodoplanes sp.]
MQIHTVQTIRKAILFVGVAVGVVLFSVTKSIYPSGETVHELIEWLGIVLIVTCILGRTWASLYIGGRKIEELVQVGPYSVSRNPLYFFSFLGAAGVGAQLGSIILAALTGGIAVVVFYIVVKQEEQVLLSRYGADYRVYLTRVPRFVPNPRLWHDEATLVIYPSRVLMTFADALVFLIAVPLAEFFEYLQEVGVLPTLLHLP